MRFQNNSSDIRLLTELNMIELKMHPKVYASLWQCKDKKYQKIPLVQNSIRSSKGITYANGLTAVLELRRYIPADDNVWHHRHMFCLWHANINKRSLFSFFFPRHSVWAIPLTPPAFLYHTSISRFLSLTLSLLASASVNVYVCETLRGIRSTQALYAFVEAQSNITECQWTRAGHSQSTTHGQAFKRLRRHQCMHEAAKLNYLSIQIAWQWERQSKKTADCKWSLEMFALFCVCKIIDGAQFPYLAL